MRPCIGQEKRVGLLDEGRQQFRPCRASRRARGRQDQLRAAFGGGLSASLDRRCARRDASFAGRDGETASVELRNL